MPNWPALRETLEKQGLTPTDSVPRSVGGGDISAAWRLETREGPVFLKTGPADTEPMFAAEAAGLEALKAAKAVRVSEILALGVATSDSFLALEWLNLDSASADTDRRLGRQLAELHKASADAHGWHRDNTIGLTPQINTWNESWVDFYRQHRLRFQLELAARKGFTGELPGLGRCLLERLPALFAGHEPPPSLLHGDLWSGNKASVDGEPVIFDPAVYYGDRETDLAMTRLFGGFSRDFYAAYEEAWPLPPGHRARLGIYQLYHVLNHLNLFGGVYLGRAEALIGDALGRFSG